MIHHTRIPAGKTIMNKPQREGKATGSIIVPPGKANPDLRASELSEHSVPQVMVALPKGRNENPKRTFARSERYWIPAFSYSYEWLSRASGKSSIGEGSIARWGRSPAYLEQVPGAR